MVTTIENLENVVRAWVEGASGRDTYIQDQMGPIPSSPYCTIFMMPIEDLGGNEYTYSADPGDPDEQIKTVMGNALVTFAISAWGGNDVMTVINRVRNSINSDQRYTDLWVISGKGPVAEIIQLPFVIDGNRRQRAEFKFSVYASLSEDFVVDYIDKVDLTIDGDTVRVGTDIPPPL